MSEQLLKKRRRLLFCLLPAACCCWFAACGSPAAAPGASAFTATTPVKASALSLTASAQPCTNAFVPHQLPFTMQVYGPPVAVLDGNGSGMALNDLDNDGDEDIVFATLKGSNAILWNDGALRFRSQLLDHGDSRGASIVDVDGDGWQDIVFSRPLQKLTYWHNMPASKGTRAFEQTTLPGVNNPAYAFNWNDLDGDGDLDLVAASYDAALARDMGNDFRKLNERPAGVFFYERRGDTFEMQRLADQSQGLAIAFPDVDGDGEPDILVGNDFEMPDFVWLRRGSSWVRELKPFARTSWSTMGFDQGDVDNDGSPELFTTDMKPYEQRIDTLVRWLPMMGMMSHKVPPGDVQFMENMLQVRGADGRLHDQAYERFIDATGWSWSGKFGDLDSDGFLDLYVVNGMIAAGLFAKLPGNELIEQNQVRRNDGTGSFTPALAWGLGSTASGRGMSIADMDGDGDLDIVVNNLLAPAQLFENRLCGGANVLADLRWSSSSNTHAIGARLALHTSAGTFYRDVRASSGYLSGDPARVHFGVPAGARLQRLDINWPDGQTSSVSDLATQTLVTVTRP